MQNLNVPAQFVARMPIKRHLKSRLSREDSSGRKV